MICFELTPQVSIAHSQLSDGDMRESSTRSRWLAQISPFPHVSAQLEHGTNIIQVTTESASPQLCDALSTTESKLVLDMIVGDCFPIVLHHARPAVLCLIHAGWKSLASGILSQAIKHICTLGGDPTQIIGWIGPGICHAAYEHAGSPAQKNRADWAPHITQNNDHYQVDLLGYIREQLLQQGLQKAFVHQSELCTYHDDKQLFSHRRATTQNQANGRFVVATWMTTN